MKKKPNFIIKPCSEVVSVFLFVFVFSIIAITILIIVAYFNGTKEAFFFLTMVFLFLFLILNIAYLRCFEWFLIYDDRIVARTIYGITNSVYFLDVFCVEKTKIQIGSRGNLIEGWLLFDGRPAAKYSFVLESEEIPNVLNDKRFCLRIPYSKKNEIIINSILNIVPIRESKRFK